MEVYAQRAAERRTAAAALRRRERTISIVRLALIAAAILLAFSNPLLILIPVIAFIAILPLHERVIRRRTRAESGAAFYDRGLERVAGTWMGHGNGGEEFDEEHHPYASDFDLFGRGSLFELICIAVTRAGRARLAAWLKQPSLDAQEIRARQEAVRELREKLDLREGLAVEAAEVANEVEAAKLDAWAAMPAVNFARWERAAIRVIPYISAIALLVTLPALLARLAGLTHPEAALRVGWFARVPLWPLLVIIALVWFISRQVAARVVPIIAAVERAEPALALLAAVLARIERETFTAPRLVAVHARIGDAATREIEALRKLVALLDARRNQFFAPIAGLLLWTPNLALAIERWRRRSGARVGGWIESVGEIEALSSLASFAFEHPDFAMPDIAGDGLDATALGHPLIPAARRITNDLHLGGDLRLLVISGSNMSGKSTMMRSTGIAAVLALAGAPVCARSLRIAPMAIGASIRINDSLQEGASRFYAEILRIRTILEMSRAGGPMLFLLDEVLAGTNSHDRRIGAEAIVRQLVERGAIGMVTTHDLALAKIADELAPRATNVHFDDHLEDGKVVFDYRMRPGVVTKSNALALMRSVGIEV
ncbi:MAG TPA: DNA mismatch repair protein MutS [Thermoanaerobaculia bacterium]|nr:DNA mismatch repair protein MutS [Thermoanaerobaculia bacterium]